jgi:hypothetical protein
MDQFEFLLVGRAGRGRGQQRRQRVRGGRVDEVGDVPAEQRGAGSRRG